MKRSRSSPVWSLDSEQDTHRAWFENLQLNSEPHKRARQEVQLTREGQVVEQCTICPEVARRVFQAMYRASSSSSCGSLLSQLLPAPFHMRGLLFRSLYQQLREETTNITTVTALTSGQTLWSKLVAEATEPRLLCVLGEWVRCSLQLELSRYPAAHSQEGFGQLSRFCLEALLGRTPCRELRQLALHSWMPCYGLLCVKRVVDHWYRALRLGSCILDHVVARPSPPSSAAVATTTTTTIITTSQAHIFFSWSEARMHSDQNNWFDVAAMARHKAGMSNDTAAVHILLSAGDSGFYHPGEVPDHLLCFPAADGSLWFLGQMPHLVPFILARWQSGDPEVLVSLLCKMCRDTSESPSADIWEKMPIFDPRLFVSLNDPKLVASCLDWIRILVAASISPSQLLWWLRGMLYQGQFAFVSSFTPAEAQKKFGSARVRWPQALLRKLMYVGQKGTDDQKAMWHSTLLALAPASMPRAQQPPSQLWDSWADELLHAPGHSEWFLMTVLVSCFYDGSLCSSSSSSESPATVQLRSERAWWMEDRLASVEAQHVKQDLLFADLFPYKPEITGSQIRWGRNYARHLDICLGRRDPSRHSSSCLVCEDG